MSAKFDVSTMSTLKVGSDWTSGDYVTESKTKACDEDLLEACNNGNVSSCKKALDAGALPNRVIALAMGQTTPLYIASQNGFIEIAELLLEKKSVNINETVGWDGQTSLHYAANAGHWKMCEYLLQHNANVHALDKLKRSALFDAADLGSPETVKILLKYHAKVDDESMEGATPLQYCLDLAGVNDGKPYFDCCYLLMQNGADMNRKGKETGRTFLHCAAGMGMLKLCKELCETKNCDEKIRDIDGKTAMNYADQFGKKDCFEYLKNLTEKKGKCVIL